MEQRFTEWQRQKLVKLGFENVSGKDVVRYGEGNYAKQVGKVYITLQIKQHYIKRFAFSILYQGVDFVFAKNLCNDMNEALKLVEKLKYFK